MSQKDTKRLQTKIEQINLLLTEGAAETVGLSDGAVELVGENEGKALKDGAELAVGSILGTLLIVGLADIVGLPVGFCVQLPSPLGGKILSSPIASNVVEHISEIYCVNSSDQLSDGSSIPCTLILARCI